MLKLATHNLYKGGPEDYSAWARDLAALDPDILLIQESCAPVRYLGKLPTELQAQARESIWVEEVWKTATETKTNPWGSAIYLKQGASSELPFPADLRGWVVGAEVSDLAWNPASPGLLRIFSIHTPTGTPRGYAGEVNAILDAIAPLATGHDVIIGGDFNITVSVRHSSEERRNTSEEEAIHGRLQGEFGLINCWQTLHPDQPLSQTFRRYFNDDPQPFHIDGLFVPSAWRPFLKSCEVSNDPTWRGEMNSDHFPMMATFAL
jgi:endonuclease/exonuclease/phosphatase family metal-dependent hydrolase